MHEAKVRFAATFSPPLLLSPRIYTYIRTIIQGGEGYPSLAFFLLSFHHPLLLAYQPFQRSPRDARANRTNTYKRANRVHTRKKKEEASIIYRVENIEKATKRDERQKEGAARAPSFPLLPSLSLHDPSPLLLPAREDVREI